MRCNKLNEIDRGLGIDKNVEKQHFGKEQFIDKTHCYNIIDYVHTNSSSYTDSLVNMVDSSFEHKILSP
ncbi:hypothetical protein RhiirA4_468575 [Rhizophagus irregularis]|uniref:Uncharacterized protein n=1 Tax=Rhizophagus irregularis TaxID=588596 RepID=A0A2I1GXY9_9GLOM|nr:hypothetical protein RhiirA4_468575 [Rhizophagus irregularis]